MVAVFLTACSPSPPSPAPTPRDATAEPWYRQTVAELAGMNRRANELLHEKKPDEAAALIVRGESLGNRLISVPHPTLAATEAASDVDELYGKMLFSNRNYGWARLLFQKNVARWKNWRPQTPETADRLKRAQDAIAECDHRMGQ
jgi:hypothetical protein